MKSRPTTSQNVQPISSIGQLGKQIKMIGTSQTTQLAASLQLSKGGFKTEIAHHGTGKIDARNGRVVVGVVGRRVIIPKGTARTATTRGGTFGIIIVVVTDSMIKLLGGGGLKGKDGGEGSSQGMTRDINMVSGIFVEQSLEMTDNGVKFAHAGTLIAGIEHVVTVSRMNGNGFRLLHMMIRMMMMIVVDIIIGRRAIILVIFLLLLVQWIDVRHE